MEPQGTRDLDLDAVLVRSKTLLYSEVDGDVTMMSIESGRYYSLTHVGARIWSMTDQPVTPREIRDRLLQEYRVEPSQCETDVLGVLRQMVEEGVLLERSTADI